MNIAIKHLIAAIVLLTVSLNGYTQDYNLSLLGKLTYPIAELSNLSTYADSLGNEYAMVGTENGLSIVDITTPSAPVQKFLIPGNNSIWREVREYKGYAYVVSEGGNALQIVNLRNLPATANYTSVRPMNMNTAHTVYINKDGILLINGSNIGNGGTMFLDLNANPTNPPVLGYFDNNYVHDCYERNDTLWAALINDGYLKIVDVSNKSTTNQPGKVMGTVTTPSNFTHNVWVDSTGKYIFTTDERTNSFLTCYDVSDLGNIKETDRIQHSPGSNAIVHNTYWLNDYCVSSYYTEGITIHDVSRKHNMVEVAHYDSSPNYAGDDDGGFHGAWGVWPFLPSGNIVVSDIEEGLVILKPTYKRACYLEGSVKDSVCGTQLNKVAIEILTKNVVDSTDLLGNYATGLVDSGTYSVRFSKAGYAPAIVNNVVMKNGVVTNVHVSLIPISTVDITITVIDSLSGTPIPGATILLQRQGGAASSVTADAYGQYQACDFVQGNYTILYGKWGYRTSQTSITVDSTVTSFSLTLNPEYYDDFALNYNWKVTGNATSGRWVRGVPVATIFNNVRANVNQDINSDLGNQCFVTGNGGGAAGDDDVDNGETILTSPVMNLAKANNPYVSYYRWFFNDGGTGNPDDSLIVTVSDGANTRIIETVTAQDTQSVWKKRTYRLKDYFTILTDSMRISFRTADNAATGHLVEAGVDVFHIIDTAAVTTAIEDINPTGINFKARQIAADKLLIELQQDIKDRPAYLSIFDVTGKQLSTTEIKTPIAQVELNCASGILFIRLQQRSKSMVKKCLWTE